MGFISVSCETDGSELVVKARRNRVEHEERCDTLKDVNDVIRRFRKKVMRADAWTEGFNG